MLTQRPRGKARSGAQTVETAIVMIWVLMFIMGTFEYGRLLMDWNVLNNAAREGCRYALANNTSTTIGTDVTTLVTSYMGGENASFTNFTVTVSGTHNGASTAVNNLAAGDMITVSVSGTYKFLNVVPWVAMPTSYTMTCSVTMGCEGGT
jgi:Flp pilus assembly protein TadG